VATLALGLGGLAPSARAALVFNANPAGPVIPGNTLILDATGFDEAVGNSVAVLGSALTPADVGTDRIVYYQAVITAINTTSGQIVPFQMDTQANGAFAGPVLGFPSFELTVIARIRERITSVVGPVGSAGATATFELAPDQSGSFIRFYHDLPAGAVGPIVDSTAPNALVNQASNNAAGSGFGGGTLVLAATPDPTQSNVGNFTLTTIPPIIAPLNQSGGGDYLGVTTLVGSGSTLFNSNTTYFNPLFFVAGGPTGISFNTTQKTPFDSANPSLLFFDGAGAYAPVVASPNGAVPGTDFLFQADANTSFLQAVPEPGTVSMAVTALGLVSLVGLRSRLRRNVPAA